MDKLCVVTPVYNDWISLRILLEKLNNLASTLGQKMMVIAVNDGSIELEPDWQGSHLDTLDGVYVVDLATNVGHQRAIAIGICVALEDYAWDALVVMDCDGEDPPEQIPHLLDKVAGRKDFAAVAQRRKRTENVTFRLSYILYRNVFKLLTGRRIRFGNFSLMSRAYARRLAMIPDLWNNLAAAILRSRLPVDFVSVDRGRRYAGTSKMNYVSLITHGLSGISVYADTIYVRLLLLTTFLVVFTALLVPTLLIIRIYFPQHATPGWATTITFGLTIILVQIFLTAISSILVLLSGRVQRVILPLADYKPYIASKHRIE
jgi:polyisoprenyl-phosphate glycosyltransferase